MKTMGAFGLAFALAAGSAGLARAQGAGGFGFDPRQFFIQLDANGDQVIDKDEVPESARPSFEQLLKEGDSNKNGRLELDEYRALLKGLLGLEEYQEVLKSMRRAAAAPPPAATDPKRFASLDKDGDGKVSREEFPGIDAVFARIDANKDGFLTEEEIAKFKPPGDGSLAWERIKAMDGDGDGKIGRDEYTGPPQVFALMDANEDGYLVREEVVKFATGINRFKALDKDGDGKISKDEFPGPPARFAKLDANNDGYLTGAELRAGMPQAGAKPKAKDAKPSK